MTDTSPAALQHTMQQLEDELQHLLNGWSMAGEALIRTTSLVERLSAPKRLQLKRDPPAGTPGRLTKEDLDALVLDWLWTEHEQLMTEQLDAEALNAAYEVKYKVATKALSSKQTRLNADIKLNAGPSR